MSQPLASANVLVESASAVASKSIILRQAPFTHNKYVLLQEKCKLSVIYPGPAVRNTCM